ncbi:hypothetical protein BHE74_00025512 [Ensete ventricosum]|nr:hypothetical protein BHE74_00025512 [Ensete ventricosum]
MGKHRQSYPSKESLGGKFPVHTFSGLLVVLQKPYSQRNTLSVDFSAPIALPSLFPISLFGTIPSFNHCCSDKAWQELRILHRSIQNVWRRRILHRIDRSGYDQHSIHHLRSPRSANRLPPSTVHPILSRSRVLLLLLLLAFLLLPPKSGYVNGTSDDARRWVEHDPTEILQSVRVCMAKALDKATAAGHNVDAGLRAIGLTNQRETTVIWSRSTGLPLYNAIVWMDARTSTICHRLVRDLPGGRDHFVPTCGLPISTYFSALKIMWLLENVDVVREAVRSGDAMFGTVDTWMIWNLTGGCGAVDREENPVHGLHVTDCSNAARTMLMDLRTLDWDRPTLDALGIPIEILPKIISNSERVGVIANGWPLAGIPIAGCLGDQHAAMLGQLCRKGEAKSTYGTGAFILLNTGDEIVRSSHGLVTTIAFKLGPEAPTSYALEGSIAIAGAAVQWLRDGMGIIQTTSEIEELAELVENSGGVYFVPAFNGLFAPWWRDDARGVCIGITRFTNKGHIARAVLESICFQVNDVLASMHKDAGERGDAKTKVEEFLLRVDGGATVNNLLMQIQVRIT